MTSERCWQVLGWSALLAGALLLASLFQAVATAVTEGAVQAEPTPIDLSTAPTTRGLCELLVGQPVYAGQNTWVTEARRQCANASN